MEQRLPLHHVTARTGHKYGPEYVTALKKQVPGLVCLGDDRPLQTAMPGWWCKLEAFAPWSADLRPCLWIDLDTYVFDLTPFESLDRSKFWMIDDFNSPQFGESGLMLLPKDTSRIWDALQTVKIDFSSPDGAFLRQFPHNRLNRAVSGIYSYKIHARFEKPDDATVICFHGKPKAPDTDGWSKKYWTRMLT